MRSHIAIIVLLFFSLSLSAQKNKLIRFAQDTYSGIVFGYVNKAGDTIVSAGKYEHLPETIKKPIIVQVSDNPEKWVMLDQNGMEIYRIYAVGENPDKWHEGLLRIVQDDKIGFINKKGKIVIQPEYCRATSFVKGKSIANINAVKVDKSTTDAQSSVSWEDGKWGVIDKKGEVLKPFDYIRVWNDSLACYEYQKEGEIFILTEKGKIKSKF